ncbi:conserved hypothetical protein [Methanothermus fervidus DSM 2088]|uniref:Uncharacterized protein n=1 Tax=Methanothermus fervidus (strain ATCC 43054 / DSM 2088 / JCM 10308 / V24 S) TaxID=523846 RepID=E3GWK8_METFV|nr:DUF5320 domain-containing protein [Methanothermus fervidus]ADP76822.1 conserved hypothetical protein [Methanothermus fervidus DSM 2088]
MYRRFFRGLRYIGPCRCGFGPHAFYEDVRGRIYHVSELYPRYYPEFYKEEDIKRELEALREEKRWIEEKIKELEKRIKKE